VYGLPQRIQYLSLWDAFSCFRLGNTIFGHFICFLGGALIIIFVQWANTFGLASIFLIPKWEAASLVFTHWTWGIYRRPAIVVVLLVQLVGISAEVIVRFDWLLEFCGFSIRIIIFIGSIVGFDWEDKRVNRNPGRVPVVPEIVHFLI
jgi:hypothetical protein